jgi:hypothetical protein
MDPLTMGLIGSSAVGALGGIFGSNSAAKAQEEAAKQQAEAARRNLLYQTQLSEPARYLGYNAMQDLNAEYGYGAAPYTSASQLAATVNPLKSKQVVKALRQGIPLEQIMQMGTTKGQLNPKATRRLIKAGLTPDQIQQLSAGGRMPGAPGAPGVAPQAAAAAPQGRGFMASPDYAFRRDEGQRDIGNSFAARGGAASGNALRALTEFNSGLASSEYGNWFNRRAAMAGIGQTATGAQGQAGQNYTNAMMGSQQQAGDARASGIMGGVNSVTGAINSGLNGWLMNKYMSRDGGYGGQIDWGVGPKSGWGG